MALPVTEHLHPAAIGLDTLPGQVVLGHLLSAQAAAVQVVAQALPQIGLNDFAVSQTRPHSTIHVGDWKLVHFYEGDRDELYRLSADASEQRDLASQEPARARDLRRRLDESLRGMGARFPTAAAVEN